MQKDSKLPIKILITICEESLRELKIRDELSKRTDLIKAILSTASAGSIKNLFNQWKNCNPTNHLIVSVLALLIIIQSPEGLNTHPSILSEFIDESTLEIILLYKNQPISTISEKVILDLLNCSSSSLDGKDIEKLLQLSFSIQAPNNIAISFIDRWCDMPSTSEKDLMHMLCLSIILGMSDPEILLLIQNLISKNPSKTIISSVLALAIITQSRSPINYDDLEEQFLFIEDQDFLESIKSHLLLLNTIEEDEYPKASKYVIESLTKAWLNLNPDKKDLALLSLLIDFACPPLEVLNRFNSVCESFEIKNRPSLPL